MDLNITITSPDLHDAILALAEAINTAGLPWGLPNGVRDDRGNLMAPYAAPQQPQPAAASAPQPAAPPPDPRAVAPQPLTAPAQEYTLQQIAIWAVALQERNLPRLREILAAFGVQALTQLPKEQYGAFVGALAAEGVTTDAR